MQFCTSALSVTKLPGGPFPAVKLINGTLDELRIVEAETRPQ